MLRARSYLHLDINSDILARVRPRITVQDLSDSSRSLRMGAGIQVTQVTGMTLTCRPRPRIPAPGGYDEN